MKNTQAIILSAGIIMASLLFGIFFYAARTGTESISSVGAATMPFEADIVKWQLTISCRTAPDDSKAGYRLIKQSADKLLGLFGKKGVQDDEIAVQPVNSYAERDRDGIVTGQVFTQTISVTTSSLDTIQQMALNPLEISEQGITIQNSNLSYLSSDIDRLKLDLLAEAAENARLRAQQIATGLGKSVGAATSLRAGVFQIREPYSTDVSAYGIYNTATRNKEITVTVHASFTLE
jgi:hypothetical protein